MVKICSICQSQFELRHDHKGYADVCMNCGGQDEDRLAAEVSWENKHTPIIRVVDSATAQAFNNKNKRFGAGVLRGITTPKENIVGREASKSKSGTELGAQYISRLKEKHNLKR